MENKAGRPEGEKSAMMCYQGRVQEPKDEKPADSTGKLVATDQGNGVRRGSEKGMSWGTGSKKQTGQGRFRVPGRRELWKNWKRRGGADWGPCFGEQKERKIRGRESRA